MLRHQHLREDVRAAGFKLPPQLERVEHLGLTKMEPWAFLDPEDGPAGVAAFISVDETLRRRYPARLVVPFARRIDNDDVAVLVVRDATRLMGAVLVVNQAAHAGFEVRSATDFWGWFRDAVEQMIERIEDEIGGDAA